jgi:predicted transcriptional regulator
MIDARQQFAEALAHVRADAIKNGGSKLSDQDIDAVIREVRAELRAIQMDVPLSPASLAALEAGLADARAGRVSPWNEDFTKYLSDEEE